MSAIALSRRQYVGGRDGRTAQYRGLDEGEKKPTASSLAMGRR